ncbi:centrosomal protein of 295 kDa isoform X2 [Xyrichtys novacula]|uniref:Centrosomal protein of 295 kDa isoform X2 n=1 Tax=Xyrichtys novacula TaxID=13765 RepID=A0AAV1FUM6_XYRNO|nr:centrosomal protein of 295 kDa isoform X2 [Xyrichtys novacula]
MKRKETKFRLSPNEEAQIIREEKDKRRKLRIQQVREQQRYIALHIRQEVEQRRRRELEKLGEELRVEWEKQQREKVDTLQRLYQESLQLLGQGHRSAKENDSAARTRRAEENLAKAEERHRDALKELKSQKLKERESQNRSINARKKALQAEKERSAKVASLPPPPPNPFQNIDSKTSHVVTKSDVSVFAGTYYHMAESAVHREEETLQRDAHEEAELEVRRLQELQREEQRRREEQLKKARLRGRQALRREHQVQDRERLLVELEHMQQTDLLRRRQQTVHMPAQIFQPLYKRQETREDFQREMEFAFEDMYTGERRMKGDLVVQLVPEPLPALSTDGQDQDLDITQDEISSAGNENTQQEAEKTGRRTSAHGMDPPSEVPSKPAPRGALKKLLDRIRSQRNQWTEQNSCVSAENPPPLISDQVLERDTTIDTGSLSSEEKINLPPTVSPPSGLTRAESADGLDDRIQEFEEERKKREEELEMQKKQQEVLLQELEEQKDKLEKMLLEAQQEREHLNAVVVQEEAAKPSGFQKSPKLVPPLDQDGHTSRIREYQQRLLEQNRIHQRSVQVARQRLEEYQRALRIRHNMAATPMFLSLPPATLLQPPTAPGVSPKIHVQPQTSAEVPVTESGTPSSPAHPTARFLSDEEESTHQRRDVLKQLTDKMEMERRTKDLRERDGPPSVTSETLKPPHGPPPHLSGEDHQVCSPQMEVLRSRDDEEQREEEEEERRCRRREEEEERRRREEEEERRRREEEEERRRREEEEEEERRRREEEEEEERRRREEEEEEERRRREEEREPRRRRKKEELQPVSDSPAEVLVPARLDVLVYLLRTLEENNGGTLSHLQHPEEEDDDEDSETELVSPAGPPLGSAPPHMVLPPPPPRAAKPPVTRVWPGVVLMMSDQHELSAIQEVDTPVNMSLVTGPEEKDPEDHEGLQETPWSKLSLQAPSPSSRGQQTAEGPSQADSKKSGHVTWRPSQLTETSSESSDSVLRRISGPSSDSGRGEDFSGPAVWTCRSPAESSLRSSDLDCISSTTISTGSYITTDPDQNLNPDKSPSLKDFAEKGLEPGSLVASPPSDLLDHDEGSLPIGRANPAIDSLFNDSSIQRIIDRYSRELDISLNAREKTTDGPGSGLEDPGPSVSQRSLVCVSDMSSETCRPGSSAHQSPLSDPAADRRTDRERIGAENPVQQDSSPAQDQDQDSFRPLIGQLADQSSCLTADHRDSTMEQLVGQPSAHSSMIDQRLSFDQSRWDSTLTRLMGRFSHQSGSHWLSGGQDFYAGQLIGEMSSTTWLDGGLVETQMRPLVGELDESSGQNRESSGEKTRVDLDDPAETRTPSYPLMPPESSGPHSLEQTLQSPTDLVLEQTEDSDSFHLLPAEVTHNQTADPSMTSHHPGQAAMNEDGGVPAPPDDPSVPSPERLRPEEPSSWTRPQLALSALTDLEFAALNLSSVNVSDSSAGVDGTRTENTVCVSENDKDGEPGPDQGSNPGKDSPVAHVETDALSEKGILEQSEITLVSLTDTTLQDQETFFTDEEEQSPAAVKEGGGGGAGGGVQVEEQNQNHSAMVLEVQWGPGENLQEVCQQKCRALLQRSSSRVEKIKAKKRTKTHDPAQPGEQSAAQQVNRKKTEPEDLQKIRKGGSTEQHRPAGTSRSSQRRSQPPPAAPSVSLKILEEKFCTPEQRRRDATEMHQRTQRLYEQLEEVKQQKAVKCRQEASAKNRLKAKEFHKKTLQKLRARNTQQ